MYVGRIVAVARSQSNRLVAMYRISSRSFPNRETRLHGDRVAVVPKAGFESDVRRNPFITYNCLRLVREYAVVGNGAHVDPIANTIAAGGPTFEAIASVLERMGYESDDHKTPRIVAVADRKDVIVTFGVVRHDGLFVKGMESKPGEAFYVATYEHDYPSEKFCDREFRASNAEEACDYIMRRGVFSFLEHPIAAASAYEADGGYELATRVSLTPP